MIHIVLLALALSLPILGGCIFSPKRGTTPPPPPPLDRLVRSSPQNVLNNLIKGYTERDSVIYKDCFDDPNYLGSSYNGFDAFPPVQAFYSFDDEAAHISKLQRSTTISKVSLDLPNYTSIPMDTLAGDPVGWVTLRISNPRVEIDDQTGSTVITTGETFEYKFIPTDVASTVSPTGKLWRIIRWTEIAP